MPMMRRRGAPKTGKYRVGKAAPATNKPTPSARAMERANSNAAFKRPVAPQERMTRTSSTTSGPAAPAPSAPPAAAAAAAPTTAPKVRGKSAQAPGQLKKAAGAQSARDFAPGRRARGGK